MGLLGIENETCCALGTLGPTLNGASGYVRGRRGRIRSGRDSRAGRGNRRCEELLILLRATKAVALETGILRIPGMRIKLLVDLDLDVDERRRVEHHAYLGVLVVLRVQVQQVELRLVYTAASGMPLLRDERTQPIKMCIRDQRRQFDDSQGHGEGSLLDRRKRFINIQHHPPRQAEERSDFIGGQQTINNLGKDLLRIADAKVEGNGLHYEPLEANGNLVRLLEDLDAVSSSTGPTGVAYDITLSS